MSPQLGRSRRNSDRREQFPCNQLPLGLGCMQGACSRRWGSGCGSSEPPTRLAVAESTGGRCQPCFCWAGFLAGCLGTPPCEEGGMHQAGLEKAHCGLVQGAGGCPLQKHMVNPAPPAGRSQAAPQNLPACSRHQLMGTIPAPRPSPGRRGSWLLSGGCEGGERAGGGEAQAHRPGAGACQALNPEQSSQARGATGSPRTPFPPALLGLHQVGVRCRSRRAPLRALATG